jgi:pyrroloquinoline quinone (PQQ) biosynthesis protein C
LKDILWLQTADSQTLEHCLLEYRFLVRRFTQWLAAIIARSDDQRIGQLLLDNLVDELGGLEGPPSHLQLLDALLTSCGVLNVERHRPSAETVAIEAWFLRAVREEPVLHALCVLGPGTEAISSQFLEPLERGVVRAFPDRKLDVRYFDVHRTQVEARHAEDINKAIELACGGLDEVGGPQADKLKTEWAQAARQQHEHFWRAMRAQSSGVKRQYTQL